MTASRLATADPNLKILIVEQGPHSEDLPQVAVPGIYLSNMIPGSTTQRFHMSNPVEHLGGRVAVVPTGRALGGGSAVNCTLSSFDQI